MGLTVYYSNRIDQLASNLANSLREERREQCDPFLPQTVLVPNPHVASWLKIQIGRELGVAANLRFPFLEEGLWRLALERLPDDSRKRVRLLKREEVHLLILAELLDPVKLEDYPEFRDYLSNPPTLSDRGRVLRAWQLAERLANLFSDYEYHRQEMVSDWIRRPTRRLPRPMEACQRKLYLSLFGPKGAAFRPNAGGTGRIPLTLPELTRELGGEGQGRIGSTAPIPDEVPNGPVHLFGFSQLSPFHIDLLFTVAETREVLLHQFNHAPELWLSESERADQRPGAGPVEFWGRPGVEFVQLVNAAASRFSERVRIGIHRIASDPIEPGSLLSTLQQWVRQPGQARSGSVMTQDVSLQVVGCAGRFREVETVYNSILENLRADPDLRATDIAVLVSDMRTYQPILESVFDRGDHSIPYNLSDSTADRDSHFAQGLLQLLELAESRFTRKEVFDFLFNPLARESLGVARAQVRQWLDWTDALNIYDSAHEKGGGPEASTYSWRWGFRRLELGQWMETLPADREGRLPNFEGVVPYSDLDSLDSRETGAFVMAVNRLEQDVRRLARGKRTAARWAAILDSLIERHLRIPPDQSGEIAVRESLFRSLRRLEILEAGEGAGVSFEILREFVRSCLGNIPSRRGRFLTGGVTLSSMRPLRPIPFKIVYILGLDEGKFPGSAGDSTLDLRSGNREIGDVSTPEANRHLFLETLMATGSKLYLTYPNHDLQKDRAIAPCSTVEEIKRFASECMSGAAFQETSTPISGSSPEYLKPGEPSCDARVNHSLRDRFLCLLRLRDRGFLDSTDSEEIDEWANLHHPDPRRPGNEKSEATVRMALRLGDLSKFLEDPLEAAIRRSLSLYDEGDEDPGLEEDEPIYSGYPVDYQLLTRTLTSWVLKTVASGSGDAAEVLTNLYTGESLLGSAPTGAFGRLDLEAFQETAKTMQRRDRDDLDLGGLLSLLRGMEFHEVLQMGESSDVVERRTLLPEIRLPLERAGDGSEARFQGSLPLLWRGDRSLVALVLAPTSSIEKKGPPPRQLLRPFLFHQALLALEALGGEPFVGNRDFFAAVQSKKDLRIWRFHSDPNAARSYFSSLLQDYLFPTSFNRLPLKAFSLLGGPAWAEALALLQTDEPTREQKGRFLELLAEGFEKSQDERNNRESELAALFETPLDPDAYAISRRRLLPYLLAEPVDDLMGALR